ncbi:putative house-cleaning noncanonical NTP pyrophosphatase (MazG superfamily) [Paraburkholderia bannensis]|uniref:Putative house-cleaning noncanonical NTP pyrophosphatase (MazG superfamily) n=1 Tax=Paraburkholderia bannensis TaxID=765414 RepID=A0A7W9U1P1_9BURK|nr:MULTISPECIES: nucleoside triphosphate pyrophosphohydrolase [Paraburkholderia]MBB3260372.1 putative house-cleaning noncanonical NTP pyrophosphatase (MazG superfamily) [Paraburkholderia sp. WP4_3_2]MBB6105408.1 putative house-cleaning noncanonical NTP pyrophosphatase (MazG superfamily) [Paraburkholderia bannensis]
MANNKIPRAQRSATTLPSPIHDLRIVTTDGLQTLRGDKITPAIAGWKAVGLCTMPAAWVPPFFVISAACFGTNLGQLFHDRIEQAIKDILGELQLSEQTPVFIRSSGVAETLHVRGQLDSIECSAGNILSSAKALVERLNAVAPAGAGTIHLVVQKSVSVAEKGHLSNERRLSREPRDWVAEFEPINGERGRTESVAVRTWRSGKAIDTVTDLACDARAAVGIVLKRVGGWAMQFASRMHFEWVWDKSAIWLVQADVASISGGIDPRSVIPAHIPKLKTDELRAFKAACESDFATYGKLRNASMYGELGYQMPPFYVLNQPEIIHALLRGEVTDELAADLSVLTQRPFIIRTDGTQIPKVKREMLPRSDELRSLADATEWLTTTFAQIVIDADLADTGLCLIAHHFIPSVASAWARAEPGNPLVRIESLWGIPEGLYWHSHDTFEVDTGSRDIRNANIGGHLEYGLRERLRYKGTFIAADDEGHWIPQITDIAHDWARSITRTQWIFEIAQSTRRIAERCQQSTAVMWFVDNHREATPHRVLPWFHSPSTLDGGPKAAPRRKRLSSHDFVIRHAADWAELQSAAEGGQTIERVVMAPIDAELIRNASFATDLAKLAKTVGFVVELSGGILSHAYYMLNREGCRVECVDLFGAGEEVVEFHKLVRDGIPDMIRDRGERVDSIALKGDALIAALRQKLVEEALEALDASTGNELLGELADVQEVLLALATALNVDPAALEQERLKKRKKRGGFEKGLMLLKTATPQSIGKSHNEATSFGGDLSMEELRSQSLPVISDPLAMPTKSPYRRPDMRNVDGTMEKLFTFKTDLVSLSELEQRLAFEMPMPHAGKTPLVLTVELDRDKSMVRGKIRLQVSQSQLELPF